MKVACVAFALCIAHTGSAYGQVLSAEQMPLEGASNLPAGPHEYPGLTLKYPMYLPQEDEDESPFDGYWVLERKRSILETEEVEWGEKDGTRWFVKGRWGGALLGFKKPLGNPGSR